jgi:hypothetical protein
MSRVRADRGDYMRPRLYYSSVVDTLYIYYPNYTYCRYQCYVRGLEWTVSSRKNTPKHYIDLEFLGYL